MNHFIGASFQDPLIHGFARIPGQEIVLKDGKRFILKVADTVLEARNRPGLSLGLSRKCDPVLDSVLKLMDLERLHFKWEKIIIIGCSAGGGATLRMLFKHLIIPHLPIVIALHHNPGFKMMTQFQYSNKTFQRVTDIKDGEVIRGTRIYFCPGEMETGFGARLGTFTNKLTNYKQRFRPDIDMIFTEAGIQFKNRGIGIILSGMLDDGAKGSKSMALNRGEIWVQSPDTAIFPEMPKSTIRTLPMAKVKSIQTIGKEINRLSEKHLRIEKISGFFPSFAKRSIS